MAKKKIGIYGQLESTANHKVEDLYIIVDDQSIHFSVKHLVSNEYIAFESFINNNDSNGLSPLLAYLQNNSKLMHATYNNIHFVMNTPRVLLTKSSSLKDMSIYLNELNIVHGLRQDEELIVKKVDDNKSIVYAVPDSLQTLLTRAFPTGKWEHYINALMDRQLSTGVHLYIFDQFYLMLIHLNDQIEYVRYAVESGATQNTFQVLNACKHLQIDPSQTDIYISGYSHLEHGWVESLVQYFKNAVVEQAPDTGVAGSLNKEYPNHTYSTYFIF
jgi:hypothetical protein